MTDKEAAKVAVEVITKLADDLLWPLRLSLAAVVLLCVGVAHEAGWNAPLAAAAGIVGALVGLGVQFVAGFVLTVLLTVFIKHRSER